MLIRSAMPSTSVGSYGAAINETMPATIDVTNEAIEYTRSQPWNAAAAKIMAASITRHSILRSWGEFQQTYPRIVAPIATGIPSEGDRLGRRPGRRRYSRTTSPPHAMFMASSGAAPLRPAIGPFPR